MSNGGSRANRTGSAQEQFIKDWLEDLGYVWVSNKDFLNLFNQGLLDKPTYTSQCNIGTNIYNKKRVVDFILYNPEKWTDCLVIESKWQASAGSVDLKYPFEVLSINKNDYLTIIVLDGGGYSEGSEQWLKSQVGKSKVNYVVNQGGFARLASRGVL